MQVHMVFFNRTENEFKELENQIKVNNNIINNNYGIYIAPYTLCSMALHNSTVKNFVKNYK